MFPSASDEFTFVFGEEEELDDAEIVWDVVRSVVGEVVGDVPPPHMQQAVAIFEQAQYAVPYHDSHVLHGWFE